MRTRVRHSVADLSIVLYALLALAAGWAYASLRIQSNHRVTLRPDGSDEPFALGVGLAGMRERVRQVGGTFTVRAGDSGTIVHVSLPRRQK
jgi:glucose-6-phosphate-specific signal transduction histidine kinase